MHLHYITSHLTIVVFTTIYISHHITSHHISSHLTIVAFTTVVISTFIYNLIYHIKSHHITSYYIISHHILPSLHVSPVKPHLTLVQLRGHRQQATPLASYLHSPPSIYHITSHHITSHHITSHHILPSLHSPSFIHHITSYSIASHRIASHHNHITSHHITSHHITSHHITSHLTMAACISSETTPDTTSPIWWTQAVSNWATSIILAFTTIYISYHITSYHRCMYLR